MIVTVNLDVFMGGVFVGIFLCVIALFAYKAGRVRGEGEPHGD